jgi:hypothetical protein
MDELHKDSDDEEEEDVPMMVSGGCMECDQA